MRFSIYQESRTGGRRINQDRMGYLYSRDSLLMLLADGMGGHVRGEIAAEAALQTIAAIYQREAERGIGEPSRFLREAVLAAHRDLHRLRLEEGLPEVPRSTVVVCLVQSNMATWAHVGDSRLYHIRGGRIVRRTIDHSRVQSLVSAGVLKEEEARVHPDRNRIFNCLGAYALPMVDVGGPFALRHGDTLLLCSDGLWGPLLDRQIAGAFAGQTVMRAVPELIDTALNKSGNQSDNCTALAMTWVASESIDMLPPDGAPVSTLHVPAGTVTSSLRVSRPGEAVADTELTDAQIDDAVAEIQKAIQRTTKLVEGK